MEPILHVQLLGAFHLRYGDETVTTVTRPRLQSLLAYLLLHRHAHQSRRQIAFLFWPDSGDVQARGNLRRALHSLRQELPNAERFLAVDTQTVQWRDDAPYVLDVAVFERAVSEASAPSSTTETAPLKALQLYQGPLLPDCFDEWISPPRERLDQQYLQVLEQLVQVLEAKRDYSQAIRYARRLLRHDPLHEATYRRLMRLYALNNNRARALHTYHACVEILERELNTSPDLETEALYMRLVKQESQVATAEAVRPARGHRAALVGHQDKWSELQNLWRSVQQRGILFVVISGEAGIGKSHLAEELRRWVKRQGYATAWTRAYAAEGSLAYAPISEWLRSDALQPAVDRLEDVWRVEIARLLPELLAQRPDLPRPQPLTGTWRRQRLFQSLNRAVDLADGPLLLVLDDLQWCDRESLEWIHFLLRSHGQIPLLLVGTVRAEEVEAEHPLSDLLRELRAGGDVVEIALAPLEQSEAAELAGQVAGRELTEALTEQVQRESEGNPLFVIELVRAHLAGEESVRFPRERRLSDYEFPATSSLPPKLYAVIESRLTQLSRSSRDLAFVAAIIGRAFTFGVLALASDQDEDNLVNGLDELWQRRIIREQGADAYDFSHDKIREVAYAEIGPVRRRLLHRRVALAIESESDANLDAVSGRLAVHFERAGMTAQAIRYYRRAAAVATQTFANQDAVSYLSRALELLRSLPDTSEEHEQKLSLRVALAAALQGAQGFTSSEANAIYRQTLELCRNAEETPQFLPVLWGLWVYYFTTAEHQTAAELSEQFMLLAKRAGDSDLRLQAHHSAWTSSFAVGKFQLARSVCEEGFALYDREKHHPLLSLYGGHDPGVCSLAFSGAVSWILGYPGQALIRNQKAIALTSHFTHPPTIAQPLYFEAVIHQLRREPQIVQKKAEAVHQYAAKNHVVHWPGWAECLLGWAQAQLGQPQAGIELLRHGLANTGDSRFLYSYFLSLLVEVCLQQRQIGEASECLSLAMSEIHRTGECWWEAEIHRLWGDVLWARGDAGVERAYQQAFDIAHQQQARSLELRAITSLCRLWQKQGKSLQARQRLANSIGWFSEGHDTTDLKDAQALLAELTTT